jgi:hypothetical protein
LVGVETLHHPGLRNRVLEDSFQAVWLAPHVHRWICRTRGSSFEAHRPPNEDLAQAYRERLKKVAGFKYVPDPLPMKTRTGSTIYYLYYAAPESKGGEIGNRIVSHLFDKYRKPRSF